MKEKNFRPVIIWLLAGCFLIYAMVLIGGITRLTHSGLSIVNWSLFGNAPPSSGQQWNKLFEDYKNYPEYQEVNFNFSLEEFQSIFWWEYLHRFLGRSIGVLFIFPFLFFWFKKMLDRPLLKKLLFLLLLGGLQGLLGWYMVKSGLNKRPSVSHYRLAAHLISAFTVFGFTFWTALSLIYNGRTVAQSDEKVANKRTIHSPSPAFFYWAILLFCVVVIQIIYGAFVAGLKAGQICPTWPKMCGEWVHDSAFTLSPLWKNFTENGAGVQFIHRYIAYVVVLLVSVLFFKARKVVGLSQLQKRIINALGIIVLFQFTLGVLTLIYSVPVLLGVLHQTGAFVLFGTSLYLIHSLSISSRARG